MVEDIVIIGAGLAGLSCARRLAEAGRKFLLLDSADAVGGRIRTDFVDGFRLDRGFQVFLDSYPEATRFLDLKRLQLRAFQPGSMVRYEGQFFRLIDPWRRPFQGMRSAFSPIGSFPDKLRIARLRARLNRGSVEDRLNSPDITTLESLKEEGFSQSIIERFFRPFLGGIFLEPELKTSNRMFEFVFRMFSNGNACLPSDGMEALPRQLAEKLPSARIRLRTKVIGIDGGRIFLANGEELSARQVIVATEGPVAGQLLPGLLPVADGQGVRCLYFSSDKSPIKDSILVLNGEGSGPINNLCVPSLVAPSYAPAGRHLISVTVLGNNFEDPELQTLVTGQLKSWFGSDVDTWKHLKTYRIPYALPRQAPPALLPSQREVRIRPGLFVCGDHRDNSSINGALVSGRRCAEAAMAEIV